jgi:hypothetical protein
MRYGLVFDAYRWDGTLETDDRLFARIEELLTEPYSRNLNLFIDVQGSFAAAVWFDKGEIDNVTADLWQVRATAEQYNALLASRVFVPESFQSATLICSYGQQVQS